MSEPSPLPSSEPGARRRSVVHHACAGHKDDWEGADNARPLDPAGNRPGGGPGRHPARGGADRLIAGPTRPCIDALAPTSTPDQAVSPAGLGALLCDSVFHRLLFTVGSGILDYGRSTRAWPVDLYNAIALRDGGCRFGACDAPASWCDVHHVHPWEHGGETSVTNGIMGCRRHHHMVHQPGYAVKLRPDGTVEFTHLSGRVETSHPRGTAGPTLFRPKPDGS